MILYHLGQVRAIDRPVDFVTGDYMPAQGRWTTRLGLERAGSINELALETEPEWRILEWLRASAKVWNRDPEIGPTVAKDAYIGAPFKVNRQYAEQLGSRWGRLKLKS